MNDQTLRDRLSSLAGDVPPQTAFPQGLVRRAHRRATFVMTATVACVALLGAAATTGLQALLRAEPDGTTVTGPVVPVPATDDQITVVLAAPGGSSNGAVQLDPDGEPAAYTKLPLGRRGFPMAWSPDGRSLAFSDDSGSGMSVLREGAIGPIVQGRAVVGASWSPDGARIAFGSGLPFDASIHVIEADGTGEQVLLPSTETDWFLFPAWSPDGSRIAFMRADATLSGCAERCDLGAELWVMNADGTGAGPIVESLNMAGGTHTPPIWSPDGSRIAFSAYVGAWGGDVEIFVANADGSGLRQLTDGPGAGTTPAWSPDGTRIAFLRPGEGAKTLWLIDADGSNERPMPAVPLVFDNSAVLWSRPS